MVIPQGLTFGGIILRIIPGKLHTRSYQFQLIIMLLPSFSPVQVGQMSPQAPDMFNSKVPPQTCGIIQKLYETK